MDFILISLAICELLCLYAIMQTLSICQYSHATEMAQCSNNSTVRLQNGKPNIGCNGNLEAKSVYLAHFLLQHFSLPLFSNLLSVPLSAPESTQLLLLTNPLVIVPKHFLTGSQLPWPTVAPNYNPIHCIGQQVFFPRILWILWLGFTAP